MTFNYDHIADVLYVTFEQSTTGVSYIENREGDILRIDKKSGKIVGVTVVFFLRRAKLGPITVPEV